MSGTVGGMAHRPGAKPATAKSQLPRLRRYPALAFLAAAAVLATLLPSALRLPLSGPAASAELAPVPGRGEGVGDLSALDATTTHGLGRGSGQGTGSGGGSATGPDDLPPPPGTGRHLRNKRCVGSPARQTEDPLSPACVGFFEGDNGGGTAKGVTRDEVRVAWVDGCGNHSGTQFTEQDAMGAPGVDTALLGYVNYFNDRFQTFGRRVRLWRVSPACNTGTPTSLVADIDEKLDPFAILSMTNQISWRQQHAVEAARRRIVTTLDQPARSLAREYAPYLLSYSPDLEDHAEQTAAFVCDRLAGRVARYAGDPTLQGKRRKFALVYSEASDPSNAGAELIRNGIRRRCGSTAGDVRLVLSSESEDMPAALAAMRTDDVTTVVYPGEELSFITMADGQKWHPEWLLTNSSDLTDHAYARLQPPATWRGALGFTHARRLEAPSQQPYANTAREGCGCDTTGNPYAYNELLLLFWGIQAAGPRLTPANMDRGLHALEPRQSADPRMPAAYFAPGNYSFVKDVAALRWDPTGTLPGNAAPGCYRLVEGGKRYREEDWRTSPGDELLAAEGQPCQGD